MILLITHNFLPFFVSLKVEEHLTYPKIRMGIPMILCCFKWSGRDTGGKQELQQEVPDLWPSQTVWTTPHRQTSASRTFWVLVEGTTLAAAL